jgi:hypothetical protein
MNIKEAIIQSIHSRQVVRDTDLALDVMGLIGPSRFDRMEADNILLNLVLSQEIIELTYKLPDIDIWKKIYFPKDTLIKEIEYNE